MCSIFSRVFSLYVVWTEYFHSHEKWVKRTWSVRESAIRKKHCFSTLLLPVHCAYTWSVTLLCNVLRLAKCYVALYLILLISNYRIILTIKLSYIYQSATYIKKWKTIMRDMIIIIIVLISTVSLRYEYDYSLPMLLFSSLYNNLLWFKFAFILFNLK